MYQIGREEKRQCCGAGPGIHGLECIVDVLSGFCVRPVRVRVEGDVAKIDGPSLSDGSDPAICPDRLNGGRTLVPSPG